MRTQQYIKLNTGAKEIQQVNPTFCIKQHVRDFIVWAAKNTPLNGRVLAGGGGGGGEGGYTNIFIHT